MIVKEHFPTKLVGKWNIESPESNMFYALKLLRENVKELQAHYHQSMTICPKSWHERVWCKFVIIIPTSLLLVAPCMNLLRSSFADLQISHTLGQVKRIWRSISYHHQQSVWLASVMILLVNMPARVAMALLHHLRAHVCNLWWNIKIQ